MAQTKETSIKTECANCLEDVNVFETHQCPDCNATLCYDCICEDCENQKVGGKTHA